MGVYAKRIIKAVVEVDGVKLACTKFATRWPTFREMDNPAIERRMERLSNDSNKTAKFHVENGVKFAVESMKGELNKLCEGDKVSIVAICALTHLICETRFDNGPVGYVIKKNGELKIEWLKGAMYD